MEVTAGFVRVQHYANIVMRVIEWKILFLFNANNVSYLDVLNVQFNLTIVQNAYKIEN